MTSLFSSSETDVLERVIDVDTSDSRSEHIDIDNLYEVPRCVQEINERKCKQVALQFPDFMLPDAVTISRKLESDTQARVFILADTSYGNYDVDEVAASHIDADLIIHFGKSALTATSSIKTLYVLGKQFVDAELVCSRFKQCYQDENAKVVVIEDPSCYCSADILTKHLQVYKNVKFSTVEFSNNEVVAVKKTLKECDTSLTENSSSCSVSAESCCRKKSDLIELNHNDVEKKKECYQIGYFNIPVENREDFENHSIFFIGHSDSETLQNILVQHPSTTGFVYNIKSNTCQEINSKVGRFLAKRFFYIEKIKDAKRIGIVLGTLGMSEYLQIHRHLKTIIEKSGKKSYTFVVGKINPAKLANFAEVDVYCLIACPEQSLVDSKEYEKPIVTPYDIELALNKNRQWGEQYIIDYRELLEGSKGYVSFCPNDSFDMSLITGAIRTTENGDCTDTDQTIATQNNENALLLYHPNSAARHFSERSWQGLEQKLGETAPSAVKPGRDGIPMSYSEMQS